MSDRDCDNCAHHSDGGCSVWECSFERKKDDLLSRRAVIDAVENGMCIFYDCDVLEKLKDLPPAHPDLQPTCNNLATDCISRQAACEYCHEDSDGYVMPLEKNCHAFIRFGMDGWELSLKAKGWNGSAKIKYCPMCGRSLTHE